MRVGTITYSISRAVQPHYSKKQSFCLSITIYMRPLFFFVLVFLLSGSTLQYVPSESQTNLKKLDNDTVYRISKQLCWNCLGEAIQFLFHHNLVRATKMELPLTWDSQLENYAKWWATQRRKDCTLTHSFPEGDFKLGENIYWGSGSSWTPTDAVNAWAAEQKYYDYTSNSCVKGQLCGHYTQIVWKTTRRIGCARVVCESGDVFMTCNYFPPGNYIGEKPY